MTLKSLFRKATNKAREESFVFGRVGKKNPTGPATLIVEGRPDKLWVTLSDKTPVEAYNEAGVSHTEDMEVKLRVEFGAHVIVGRSSKGTLTVPTPTPPSGVLPHPIEEHSDAVITAAASGDVLAHNGTNWVDEAPVVVSAGAGSAGKLVRLDAAGHVDATTINDGDIDHTAITNIGTNTHAQIDSHIAATAAHGATGAVTGTTNAQTLQNKTLDSTNISTLTAKATPIDADSAVIVDSAAANVFKRTLWSDVKAFLKTYFDTLYAPVDLSAYALLAGRAGGQTLRGDTASGGNLTLMSTNHATKGKVLFGTSGYDEVNNRLGIRTQTPGNLIEMVLAAGNTTGQGLQLTGQNNGYIKFVNATSTPDQFIPAFDATGSDAVEFGIFLIGRPPDDASNEAAVRISARTRSNTALTAARAFEIYNFATQLFVMRYNGQAWFGDMASVGASVLGIKAGASSNDAAVGGVLYVDSTQYANGTTIETDLASYSVPANTLAVNNQILELRAWGTFVNNGNTKTLRLYFGADTWTLATIVVGVTSWSVSAAIVRTGATTQKVVIEIHTGTSSNTIVSTAARTLSSANILKLTGQSSAASNEVTQECHIVKWADANS